MSKMFDALKWAEQQRRKKILEQKRTAPAEQEDIRPMPPVSKPPVLGSLPEGFMRELGILRNSLDSALKEKERKALLFSGSTGGEGATTICVNYAKLLALHGNEKVLLCEMNARRPAFAEIFSLTGEAGVLDFFSGDRRLSSIVHHIDNAGIYVIHIGKPDPTILQLHLASVFPKLVEAALNEFTAVIFDAPPITSSPETPAMSTFVDGVVLVIQSEKTKREVVQRSLNAISQLDGKVLGVVLNRKRYYIPEFLYKRV